MALPSHRVSCTESTKPKPLPNKSTQHFFYPQTWTIILFKFTYVEAQPLSIVDVTTQNFKSNKSTQLFFFQTWTIILFEFTYGEAQELSIVDITIVLKTEPNRLVEPGTDTKFDPPKTPETENHEQKRLFDHTNF